MKQTWSMTMTGRFLKLCDTFINNVNQIELKRTNDVKTYYQLKCLQKKE